MDMTNQQKTAASSPPTDGDIDALAKRLSVNWANSVPEARQAGSQVTQRLPRGRVHVVAVESKRSRWRPSISRA
jgi:hypothetical protein